MNNPWILKKFVRTGAGISPLNPPPDASTEERYKLFDKENIFYIVRTPDGTGPNGKGSCWKLGKASVSQADMVGRDGKLEMKGGGGRARLTSYYNSYGSAPNFYVHTVYTFKKRKFDEAGEFGAAAYRWVDSVFEKLVKNYLTGVMKVKPVRGSEYMEKLEDIQTAVEAVMKGFTFAASIRRLSERLKLGARAVNAAFRREENPTTPEKKKIQPGMKIQVRWDEDGKKGIYDGIVGDKVKNKVAVWNVLLSSKKFKPDNYELNLNRSKFYDTKLNGKFSWRFTSDERIKREKRAITATRVAENTRARRALRAAKEADVLAKRRERTRGAAAQKRAQIPTRRITRSQTQRRRNKR